MIGLSKKRQQLLGADVDLIGQNKVNQSIERLEVVIVG